jgi:hypothetical protein
VLVGCAALALVALSATGGKQASAIAAESRTATGVGPGPVVTHLHASDSTLALSISPNRFGAWNSVVLTVTRSGHPVRHAAVTVRFTMLDMSMGTLTFSMPEKHPGRYVYNGPATTMPGRWQLAFRIKLRSGQAIATAIQDHVN